MERLIREDLVSSFARDCALRKMTEETIRSYLKKLGVFRKFLDSRGLTFLQVDREVLKDFVYYLRKTRKNSQGTVEHHFSAISTFYGYLVYEGIVDKNPVPEVRKRYLRRFKDEAPRSERKLISVEEMSALIDSVLDPRDKAIAILLAKTGMRRGELVSLDVDDVHWEDLSIRLKPTPKRSNLLVFFDDECARVLKRWLDMRDKVAKEERALFLSEKGKRMSGESVRIMISKWAERAGLHDPSSPRIEDHFTPHCFRHWFSTHLLRNGMQRELVKELRGDARHEAIDIYHRIDREELRRSYLAHIPRLGI
jgi:integrase/recombinase XerD